MQAVPVDTQKSKYNSKHFLRDMTIGTIATTAYVATRALNKDNRADSFVKTTKKCLKVYTEENRKSYSEFFKSVKLEDFSKWIDKVGTKKLCATLLAGTVVLEGVFFGSILDWITKKKNK